VAENIMRLLAVSMEQRLGQRLIFEAKPGAAGNIGTQEVARAAPDGYTLLVAATNNYVINQFVIKMTFDPIATLAPIAKAAEVPLVLFSNPEVPARTVREFIDYARANPGKANYGIPSLGTVNHLMMERLKQTTGVEITRVPYRGSPEATLALLKNDIQLFPIGLAAVGGHFKEGRGACGRDRQTCADAAGRPDHGRVGVSGLRRLQLVGNGCAGRHAGRHSRQAGSGGGRGTTDRRGEGSL
jgi:tripartite-type tricarboxylate transporter receptor subunit TctC